MNLLAHLHLGERLSPTESAGNLTADFCREMGSLAFRRGVQFHRAIDAFTDRHATVAEARAIFSGEQRRFGGVLSDLAFDFCLSRTWSEWAGPTDRYEFIDARLADILEATDDIPSASLMVLRRMAAERWLHHYEDPEGIRASIARLAARRPIASKMIGAELVIDRRYDEFVSVFRAFYPQLLEHVAGLLARPGWSHNLAPSAGAAASPAHWETARAAKGQAPELNPFERRKQHECRNSRIG